MAEDCHSSTQILLVGCYNVELSQALESLGAVVTVRTVEEALRLLMEGDYSLVVMDQAIGQLGRLREAAGQIPVLQTGSQENPEALFLESILENLPHMVFVKEAETLRFVRFNAAGERLLNIPREELVGRNDFDFFPPEEAAAFQAKDREVLDMKTLRDIPEETLSTPHGNRLLHTKKIPIHGPDGEPLYLLGISEDITELRAAQTAVAAKLQSARENERRRVALELHDELAQLLIALKLDVGWLESRIPEEFAERAASMSELLDQTLDSTRRLAKRLRPPIIDDLGLLAGLRWLGTEICHRRDIETRVVCNLDDSLLSEDASIVLFRICQEALNNVARHSGADDALIELTQEGENVVLTVTDNGCGRDLSEFSMDSLGTIGMRERISTLGGRLLLRSERGVGTTVTATAPKERCFSLS